MWVEQVTDEQLAEFLHNYQQAFGIGGKGCESASPQESIVGDEKARSRQYFAKPGEADWGC
jgi:hypothetical protein